ncbi:hypothetical protein C7I85_23075 [Mesorhizobium soli]|uniref:LysR substrate-binding domain-containing protein n=1 Tax=Pseudaminobacter soli (ex Li et al. 2025) TaxID=1295366 RepID=A0A2P7S3R7_9HYPH|nr:hypothetical protein C7I85_23075 [Mesorhizobium soli]
MLARLSYIYAANALVSGSIVRVIDMKLATETAYYAVRSDRRGSSKVAAFRSWLQEQMSASNT